MMDAEEKLRKALTEVRLAPAYERAINKGVKEAMSLYPNNEPRKQLIVARRVALRELAARIGWDIPS
jgi:hypothetical protein